MEWKCQYSQFKLTKHSLLLEYHYFKKNFFRIDSEFIRDSKFKASHRKEETVGRAVYGATKAWSKPAWTSSCICRGNSTHALSAWCCPSQSWRQEEWGEQRRCVTAPYPPKKMHFPKMFWIIQAGIPPGNICWVWKVPESSGAKQGD